MKVDILTVVSISVSIVFWGQLNCVPKDLHELFHLLLTTLMKVGISTSRSPIPTNSH